MLEYQKFLVFILTVLYNYFNNLTKLFSDSYPTKFFYIATNYFVIAPRVTCVEIMRSYFILFYTIDVLLYANCGASRKMDWRYAPNALRIVQFPIAFRNYTGT